MKTAANKIFTFLSNVRHQNEFDSISIFNDEIVYLKNSSRDTLINDIISYFKKNRDNENFIVFLKNSNESINVLFEYHRLKNDNRVKNKKELCYYSTILNNKIISCCEINEKLYFCEGNSLQEIKSKMGKYSKYEFEFIEADVEHSVFIYHIHRTGQSKIIRLNENKNNCIIVRYYREISGNYCGFFVSPKTNKPIYLISKSVSGLLNEIEKFNISEELQNYGFATLRYLDMENDLNNSKLMREAYLDYVKFNNLFIQSNYLDDYKSLNENNDLPKDNYFNGQKLDINTYEKKPLHIKLNLTFYYQTYMHKNGNLFLRAFCIFDKNHYFGIGFSNKKELESKIFDFIFKDNNLFGVSLGDSSFIEMNNSDIEIMKKCVDDFNSIEKIYKVASFLISEKIK